MKTKGSNVNQGKPIRFALRMLQHILFVVVVVSLLNVTIGSTVYLQGIDGTKKYDLYISDRGKEYEDSVLFNTIMGQQAADLVRLGTIQAQMETDGAYDPKKVIDVTAFNNRESILPDRYLTAEYYLEDLLKWGKYGFEYHYKNVSIEYLAPATTMTFVDTDKNGYQSERTNYLNTDLSQYTHTQDVSANEYYEDEALLDERMDRELFYNRYQTIEGKNVEDYVSTWDGYYQLCHNIEDAAKSLYNNYEEYLKYTAYFEEDHSNIRYCIAKSIGAKKSYSSNVTLTGTTDAAIKKQFQDYGRYIHYAPDEMLYETNTAIAESTFQKMIERYAYAYPDDVEIWIAVDTTYPVNDIFKQGIEGYGNYMPYYWEMIITAVAAALLYVLILIYLTLAEGGRTYGNK